MIRRLFEYSAYVFSPAPEHRTNVDLQVARANLAHAIYQREHYEAQERLYRARIARLEKDMAEYGQAEKIEPFPHLIEVPSAN